MMTGDVAHLEHNVNLTPLNIIVPFLTQTEGRDANDTIWLKTL